MYSVCLYSNQQSHEKQAFTDKIYSVFCDLYSIWLLIQTGYTIGNAEIS